MKRINWSKMSILGIILILSISLTGCSKNKNDRKDVLQKLGNEVEYLDTQILGMLNNINNISYQKYKVESEQVTSKDATASGGKNTGGTSPDKSSGSTEESSSGGENSKQQSSQEDSQSSEGGPSNSGQNESITNYKMESANILDRQSTVDWENLKKDVENLYDTWSTIILDLYKANADNTLTQNFSTDLDTCLAMIKAEDKIKTLEALGKLYEYIPKFSDLDKEKAKVTNVLRTKASVVSAYVLVEKENQWEEIGKQLANAEQNYMPIVNNIDQNKNKEYNVNKSYVLLKELQKSVSTQDKDIFYIKYKNLIQELNILQQ